MKKKTINNNPPVLIYPWDFKTYLDPSPDAGDDSCKCSLRECNRQIKEGEVPLRFYQLQEDQELLDYCPDDMEDLVKELILCPDHLDQLDNLAFSLMAKVGYRVGTIGGEVREGPVSWKTDGTHILPTAVTAFVNGKRLTDTQVFLVLDYVKYWINSPVMARGKRLTDWIALKAQLESIHTANGLRGWLAAAIFRGFNPL